MPGETEEFRTAMEVWQPAYPTTEYGGLVFVYRGPPGTEPLFPRFDIIDPAWNSQERGEDVVLRGMRLWGDYAVGMVKDCNWLQHYENIVDPYHLLMLHQWISGDQFDGALMQGKATIDWVKTPLGVRYKGNWHKAADQPLAPNRRARSYLRSPALGYWQSHIPEKA